MDADNEAAGAQPSAAPFGIVDRPKQLVACDADLSTTTVIINSLVVKHLPDDNLIWGVRRAGDAVGWRRRAMVDAACTVQVAGELTGIAEHRAVSVAIANSGENKGFIGTFCFDGILRREEY